MYGQDTGGLGYAIAAAKPSLATLVAQAQAARAAPIASKAFQPIFHPVAKAPTPVLKLPTPNIAPPASTPAPGQPPVMILPDQPITTYDAAPAAGGPSSGTVLTPNVSDALSPEVTQASLFDSSKLPLMLAILAGAWFLSRRK